MFWPSHMACIEFGNTKSVTQTADNKSCFLIRSQHDKISVSPVQLKKLKQNGREIDFKVPNDTNYRRTDEVAEPELAAYVS